MVIICLLIFLFTLGNPISAYSPIVNNVDLNNGNNITLTEDSFTPISWTATISDPDGYADIAAVSGAFYRSGVTNGSNCTADNKNCYLVGSCVLQSCANNSCTATCTANVNYYAQPTDAPSVYASEYWQSSIVARDTANNYAQGFSPPDVNELSSFTSISVPSLNFGTLLPGQNTSSSNPTVVIKNTSNTFTLVDISGDDLCLDYPTCSYAKIPVKNIQYGTSFIYGTGATLSSTPQNILGIDSQTQSSYQFGIGIPTGSTSGSYRTQITFDVYTQFIRQIGAMCNTDSQCSNSTCLPFYRDADGDALGVSTPTKFCSSGGPPWGYVSNNTDLDDSQYCPNLAYNPGTCQKCNSGAVVLQTGTEDIFNQCSSATNSCQTDTCSGTSAACGFQPPTLVCRPSAGVCDVEEKCTGSSYSCPSDSFQSTAYNPGGTCQKCSGSSPSPLLQNSSEDLFGQCTTGVQGSISSCQAGTCAGDSANCAFLSAGTTCRSQVSSCDLAETCSGSTFSCPSDTFVSSGIRCTSTDWSGSCIKSGYSCTGNESGNYSVCDGAGGCGPGGSESRICNVASGTRCSDTGACSGQCAGTTGSCAANGGTCTGYYSTCNGTGLCNGSSSETIACTVPVGGVCRLSTACWSSGWCSSTYGVGYQYWANNDDRCTATGVCAQGENGACCDSCPLPYHSCNGYVVTNPSAITCKAINYTCASDAECCSGVCGTDADGDGYFSAAAGHTGTCQGVAKPYTDCSDSNGNIYQNISNTIVDNDQDGYTSGTAATNCVGVASTVNGRTYYKNTTGSFAWLNNSQALGASDCNDSSSTYWQNRTCYYDGDNDGYRTATNALSCVGTNCTVSSTAFRRESTAPVDCDDANSGKKLCCWGFNTGSCNSWCNYSVLNCDGYYSGSGCTGTFHLCLGCAACSTDGSGTCAAGGPAPGWNPWTYNSRYTGNSAPCLERPNSSQCIVADGYPYDQSCVWNP